MIHHLNEYYCTHCIKLKQIDLIIKNKLKKYLMI